MKVSQQKNHSAEALPLQSDWLKKSASQWLEEARVVPTLQGSLEIQSRELPGYVFVRESVDTITIAESGRPVVRLKCGLVARRRLHQLSEQIREKTRRAW